MDDKKLDEMLKNLSEEESEDFSPEFYATEKERLIARRKEIEEGKISDEKLDEMLKELSEEESEDFSPEFYATEKERLIARRREIEEEEKGPRL